MLFGACYTTYLHALIVSMHALTCEMQNAFIWIRQLELLIKLRMLTFSHILKDKRINATPTPLAMKSIPSVALESFLIAPSNLFFYKARIYPKANQTV